MKEVKGVVHCSLGCCKSEYKFKTLEGQVNQEHLESQIKNERDAACPNQKPILKTAGGASVTTSDAPRYTS